MKLRFAVVILLLFATYAIPAENNNPPRDAKTITVEMRDYDFHPNKITIPPGTTVVWINVGKHVHSVTDENGAWDSGNIKTGQKYEKRFDEKGTFKYVCVPHEEMGMTGKIVVE